MGLQLVIPAELSSGAVLEVGRSIATAPARQTGAWWMLSTGPTARSVDSRSV